MGAKFPFEAVYPVLGGNETSMSYKLFSLGAFTLAPFTVSAVAEQAGDGLKELLVQEGGVPMFLSNRNHVRLETYCREHLHGELKEIHGETYGKYRINWSRCSSEGN